MNTTQRSLLLIALLGLAAAACGSGPAGSSSTTPIIGPTTSPAPTTASSSSSSPSRSPSPSPIATPSPIAPTPSTPPDTSPGVSPSVSPYAVNSAAQAAALVFATDLRWARMVPLRPDLIGASMWYEAFEALDGYAVTITAGSGDCESGCIERHVWNYRVDRNAMISLVGEGGDDVQVEPAGGGVGPAQVAVQLVAGPVCPVEQIPPDPNCAARAVANAEVVVRDTSGTEVDRALSDQDGRVAFELTAGAYYVEAQPVEGLMGRPEAQALSVIGGDTASLLMGYDTGIR